MALTIAQGAAQVMSKYGTYINRYCGQIPPVIVAARIWHETRGVACPAPTPCCDEQGLMQLWPSTRAKYGVTDACDPEQNIRAGCAHWNSEIDNMRRAIPVFEGGPGFWKLAYLYTAIGAGATPSLIKASGATTYYALMAWVSSALASGQLASMRASFGTQSPESIATRVKNADTYVGAVMAGAGGGLVGLALAAGAAYGVFWIIRRYRRG